MEGWVYFIQAGDDGLIKVGWTANPPRKRFRGIQMCSPIILRPLGILRAADVRLERAIHARFADLREHGEWFRPGPELLTFIGARTLPWSILDGSGERFLGTWYAYEQTIPSPRRGRAVVDCPPCGRVFTGRDGELAFRYTDERDGEAVVCARCAKHDPATGQVARIIVL